MHHHHHHHQHHQHHHHSNNNINNNNTNNNSSSRQQPAPPPRSSVAAVALASFHNDVAHLLDLERSHGNGSNGGSSSKSRAAAEHFAPRFTAILDLTESQAYDGKLKLLMAGTLPRFFRFFPALQDRAMDKHLDLCEDDDAAIRIEAIRNLPQFCNETEAVFASKVADVLCQLLQSDTSAEAEVVKNALFECWIKRPSATIQAVFHQLNNGLAEVGAHVLSFLTMDFSSRLPLTQTSPTALPTPTSTYEPSLLQSAGAETAYYFASHLTRWIHLGGPRKMAVQKDPFDTLFQILHWMMASGAQDSSEPAKLRKRCDAAIVATVAGIDALEDFHPQSPHSVDALKVAIRSCTILSQPVGPSTLYPLTEFIFRKAIKSPSLFEAFPTDGKRLTVLKITVDTCAIGKERLATVPLPSGLAEMALGTLAEFIMVYLPASDDPSVHDRLSLARIECILLLFYHVLSECSAPPETSLAPCQSRLRSLLAILQSQHPALTARQVLSSIPPEFRIVQNIRTLANHLLHFWPARTSSSHRSQTMVPRLAIILPSWHKAPEVPGANVEVPTNRKRLRDGSEDAGDGTGDPSGASMPSRAPRFKRMQVMAVATVVPSFSSEAAGQPSPETSKSDRHNHSSEIKQAVGIDDSTKGASAATQLTAAQNATGMAGASPPRARTRGNAALLMLQRQGLIKIAPVAEPVAVDSGILGAAGRAAAIIKNEEEIGGRSSSIEGNAVGSPDSLPQSTNWGGQTPGSTPDKLQQPRHSLKQADTTPSPAARTGARIKQHSPTAGGQINTAEGSAETRVSAQATLDIAAEPKVAERISAVRPLTGSSNSFENTSDRLRLVASAKSKPKPLSETTPVAVTRVPTPRTTTSITSRHGIEHFAPATVRPGVQDVTRGAQPGRGSFVPVPVSVRVGPQTTALGEVPVRSAPAAVAPGAAGARADGMQGVSGTAANVSLPAPPKAKLPITSRIAFRNPSAAAAAAAAEESPTVAVVGVSKTFLRAIGGVGGVGGAVATIGALDRDRAVHPIPPPPPPTPSLRAPPISPVGRSGSLASRLGFISAPGGPGGSAMRAAGASGGGGVVRGGGVRLAGMAGGLLANGGATGAGGSDGGSSVDLGVRGRLGSAGGGGGVTKQTHGGHQTVGAGLGARLGRKNGSGSGVAIFDRLGRLG
ncbi:hypothetical protein DFJ73DRAFT_958325 [Zopfochytrium polystomum]|nr:hypothetical protein DFJ73DRAFT_958325 [Zopfochytrium polystomum]